MLFTVGHSAHSSERFCDLLAAHRVEVLVDVRSSPYSKRLPHFSRMELEVNLRGAGFRYLFLGRELGARREERECYVDGVAKYERIQDTALFKLGLSRVIAGAAKYRIALMCAEHDPLTCHRAILICRALRVHGAVIAHILRDGNLETHADAERRLIAEEGFNPNQADIFASSESVEHLLARAYEKRGDRIAHREGSEDDDNSHHRIHQEER